MSLPPKNCDLGRALAEGAPTGLLHFPPGKDAVFTVAPQSRGQKCPVGLQESLGEESDRRTELSLPLRKRPALPVSLPQGFPAVVRSLLQGFRNGGELLGTYPVYQVQKLRKPSTQEVSVFQKGSLSQGKRLFRRRCMNRSSELVLQGLLEAG